MSAVRPVRLGRAATDGRQGLPDLLLLCSAGPCDSEPQTALWRTGTYNQTHPPAPIHQKNTNLPPSSESSPPPSPAPFSPTFLSRRRRVDDSRTNRLPGLLLRLTSRRRRGKCDDSESQTHGFPDLLLLLHSADPRLGGNERMDGLPDLLLRSAGSRPGWPDD
jgi:hypothetical protein